MTHTYPYWEVNVEERWLSEDKKENQYTVEIFGDDGLYDRLSLPPDPSRGYGWPSEEEARQGAARMLRELADRIEREEATLRKDS